MSGIIMDHYNKPDLDNSINRLSFQHAYRLHFFVCIWQKHCDGFITFHYIHNILFTETYLNLTGPLCETEIIPPKQTVGLISLVREPCGRCTNTHQIHGFTECAAKCYSNMVYNSGKFSHYILNLFLLMYSKPRYCHSLLTTFISMIVNYIFYLKVTKKG